MRPQKKRPQAKFHSLQSVTRRELDVELDKEHQTANWGGELSNDMLEYAAKDAAVLLPLAEILESKVNETSLEKVAEIEHGALPAIVWMENVGIPFDAKGWKEHLERVEDDMNRLKEELAKHAPDHPEGREWNWNSHQQIKTAFTLKGIKLQNTKAETLSQCDHQLAKLLLEYKKASKMVSHFGPNLLKFVREGRIHPHWRQIGTETGRMSCSKPNAQQLPPEVRRYLCAPEGRALVWADYAQAEIRILASASGDPTLVKAFRAEKDPYKATAAAMFGVPEEEVTEEQRGAAKVVNFSFIYGAKAYGIARKLGKTENEGRRLMKRYFGAHPDVYKFLKATVQSALDTGQARTLTGRLRRFGNIQSLGFKEARAAVREAMNHPMQGGCADGLKLALALLYERRAKCPGAFPIIALHDEIVIECNEEDIDAAAIWLEQAMNDGMAEVLDFGASGDRRVPVEVEVKTGKAWAAGQPWYPQVSEHDEEEESTMEMHFYFEPVEIKVYIDYRNLSLDNYPQIPLCDECAESLEADVCEQETLEPQEAAQCEECGLMNTAALRATVSARSACGC
jgi:DNA polymerase I